jgi:hypothetical protein
MELLGHSEEAGGSCTKSKTWPRPSCGTAKISRVGLFTTHWIHQLVLQCDHVNISRCIKSKPVYCFEVAGSEFLYIASVYTTCSVTTHSDRSCSPTRLLGRVSLSLSVYSFCRIQQVTNAESDPSCRERGFRECMRSSVRAVRTISRHRHDGVVLDLYDRCVLLHIWIHIRRFLLGTATILSRATKKTMKKAQKAVRQCRVLKSSRTPWHLSLGLPKGSNNRHWFWYEPVTVYSYRRVPEIFRNNR